MKYYITGLKKYAVFSGRSRRKEYWMFILFNFIITFIIGLISGIIGAPDFSSIYSLAVLIPSIAIGVRRMHDTNRSGWWILLPIVNLIFAVGEGDKAENRFGPDPKAITA